MFLCLKTHSCEEKSVETLRAISNEFLVALVVNGARIKIKNLTQLA